MAENESLDLASFLGNRRWGAVLQAAEKGCSSKEVGALTRKAFLKAVSNTLKQFQKYGLTVQDFFAKRDSPRELRALVAKTKGHPYAKLLVEVLNAYPEKTPTGCLLCWGHSVLDRVFHQLGMRLGGSDVLPSFNHADSLFKEVRITVQPHLDSLANKLNKNPDYKPVHRSKKGEPKVDPTASQMHVSLVGGARR